MGPGRLGQMVEGKRGLAHRNGTLSTDPEVVHCFNNQDDHTNVYEWNFSTN